MDKKNAEKGNKHETLFSNSLKRNEHVVDILSNHFGIKREFVKSNPIGRSGGKADVLVRFSENFNLSANVKSFGKMGFNQAARGTVLSFVENCDLRGMNSILQEGVIRKSKKGRFILMEDESRVAEFLQNKAKIVVEFALARTEKPDLLVLYDNVKNIMYLYDLKKILSEMDYSVSFSKVGNIQIGSYILFHRKGGDGNSRKYEKTSLHHPGNNLAVKLFCKKFVAEHKPLISYKP